MFCLRLLFALAAPLLIAVPACKSERGNNAQAQPAPNPPQPPNVPSYPDDINGIYKARCAACHGDSGRGDGPFAAGLTNKPRDYTNPEVQRSVSDDEMRRTILYGGAGVGKSSDMPGHPDLQGKGDILDGLIAHLRAFEKK